MSGACLVRGRSSGAEDRPKCAWVIGIRDGRITSHVAYADYDEAERAAETYRPPTKSRASAT